MASRRHSKRKSVPKSKKQSRKRSGSKKRTSASRGSRKSSKQQMVGGNTQSGRGPEMLAMLGGIPTIELFLWDSCGACKKFQPIVDEFLLAKEFEANYIFTKVYGGTPIIPGIEITSFPSIVASIPDQGISRIIPGVRNLSDINAILLEIGMNKAADRIVDTIAPRL